MPSTGKSSTENGSLDLLGIPNLQPTSRRDEGEALIISARSREATVPRCCLLNTLVRNGTKLVRFRDHTVQGRETWVEVARQRYRCKECGNTVYEDLADIDDDRRVTRRFRQHLYQEGIKHSFSVAAEANGVHETLVRRIFEEESQAALAAYVPAMPYVLGMDELYLHGRPRFIIGDVQGKRLLDMQESRRETDLRAYFDTFFDRHRVEVVTLFLARWETCKPDIQDRLAELFALYPKLETAYRLKEAYFDIYYRMDKREANRRITAWLDTIPPEMERPFRPAAMVFKRWRSGILNYFDHPYTNAYIEGLNSLVRRMNAAGAGYTFDVLRRKAILKHGKMGEVQVFDRPLPSRDQMWTGEDYFLRIDGGDTCQFRKVGLGASLSTLEADFEAGTF